MLLNELTKAPFEPVTDTELKDLTFKNALLALASSAIVKTMPGLQRMCPI